MQRHLTSLADGFALEAAALAGALVAPSASLSETTAGPAAKAPAGFF